MFEDYFNLAFKNLKHRGARSWLTLLGIFIGVTAVVALISLGTALQLAVASQFGVSDTEIITIQAGGISGSGPPGSNIINALTEDDVVAIEGLSSVDIALPRIITSVKREYNNQVKFGMALSVPGGEKRKWAYEVMNLEPEIGRMLEDGDSNKILLGYNFWKNDNIFGKNVVPGRSVLVQDEKFEVVGIVEKQGSFMIDSLIIMNEDSLRDLMDYENKVDLIGVKVKDKDDIDKTVEDIEKLLRKRRDIRAGEDDDFEVSTPEASMQTVNSVIEGVQAFIVIVALISVFIGALGIVNTMTTSVLERKKEIGIMKAVGAKNKHVFFQFFVEAGLLGLVGGLVGIIFGTLIGFIGVYGINNWMGSELGFNINFVLVIFSLLGSFLIGAVSGIVPSLKAAKENPVEALRG